MWHTISYVSTIHQFLTDSDITELFDFVKTTNNSLNIKGILLFSDGNFFQILEGEKSVIVELFKKVQKDSRHYDLIKIFDHKMIEPSFVNYNANFTTIYKKSNPLELQKFLEKERHNNPDTFNSVSYLTNKFMQVS